MLEHIIATVAAIAPEKHLRLTMLLHDIGKPEYFTMAADGTGHFKGHAKGSCEAAERFFARLRYDRDTAERVTALIRTHDIVIENREPLIKRYLNKYSERMFFDMIAVHIADDMGKAPEFMDRIEEYRAAGETAKRIIEQEQCFSLKALSVNGRDMKELGFDGREIGEVLEFLLGLVIENKCVNEKQALLKAAEAFKEQGDKK